MKSLLGNLVELTIPISLGPRHAELGKRLAFRVIALLKKRVEGVKYSMSASVVHHK